MGKVTTSKDVMDQGQPMDEDADQAQGLGGLVIDLDSDTVAVTGDNPAFKDTPWEGLGFRIVVSPVTLKGYNRMRRQYSNRKTGMVDDTEIENALFMRQVKSWSGITAPNGKEIPCTDAAKRAIVDQVFFLAKAVNIACLNARTGMAEGERKNSSGSGAGD